jgi:hypothetical protein
LRVEIIMPKRLHDECHKNPHAETRAQPMKKKELLITTPIWGRGGK